MPNWCANRLTLSHPEPEKIVSAMAAFEAGKFLEHFMPLPNGEWEYNWCIQHWGTKWDVGGVGCEFSLISDGCAVFNFDSAWAPPLTLYSWLVDNGYEVDATYWEPGMAFAGRWTDGDDQCWEYGSMTADEIADTIDPELDEVYGISESVREWEESENEIWGGDEGEEYQEDQED